MKTTLNRSGKRSLTDAEKVIALEIQLIDYDAVPFKYRTPINNALKHNFTVKQEVIDWLWENNPEPVNEMVVDVNDDLSLSNLAQTLIDITKELDERK